MDRVKLGDVAHIQTGPFGSQLHKSDYRQNGIPVIMPQNIGDRTLILEGIACVSEEDANRLSRHKTQPNDIVYARRGDVEKHAFIDNGTAGSLCGTGCLLVRPDTGKVNPTFLSFLLNHQKSRSWVSRHAVGSNMPNINTDILSGLPLELPGRLLQDATASILSTIDNKIANNKKLMTELEETARLIYDYWFTQFDFPDENGNPYRSSGGAMVYNETLHREIPSGWIDIPLSSICKVVSGYPFQSQTYCNVGGYRVLTIKNVLDGAIDANDCALLEKLPDDLPPYAELNIGDIVLSLTGNIGRCALIDSRDYLLNQRVGVVLPSDESLKPFLYMLLRGHRAFGLMQMLSTGTSQKNLSPNDLEQIPIAFSEKHLKLFSEAVNPILNNILLLARSNKALADLRDWLLPMLMNGQILVGD